MKLSPKAQTISSQINPKTTKLGDLRVIAKEIKKDLELAMELWSIGGFHHRQLAILIMDKKLLTQEVINQLDNDISQHPRRRTNSINRLVNDKPTFQRQKNHFPHRIVGK